MTVESADVRDWTSEDRARGRTCYLAEVHDAHEEVETNWPEPRTVNPCWVTLRWCVGVRDETPYPTDLVMKVEGSIQGYWLHKQDETGPPGEFRTCRSLKANPGHSGEVVVIQAEIWKSVPREWPPMHIGAKGCGVGLDLGEATSLRDYLNHVIGEVKG